jgi:signal-transduction protein with cAMP-binding, CBS, and nucleotidyltransferase domain
MYPALFLFIFPLSIACQPFNLSLYFSHPQGTRTKEFLMTTVRDIIRRKGNDVWSIAPDASVYEALQMMAKKSAGALLVMTGDQVNGILSERDCVRKVDLQGRTSRMTKVSEIMTSDVVSVQVTEQLEECMEAMLEKNIRHLPVYEDTQLLGLISVRDVLREVVDVQKSLIAQLERFITGGGR